MPKWLAVGFVAVPAIVFLGRLVIEVRESRRLSRQMATLNPTSEYSAIIDRILNDPVHPMLADPAPPVRSLEPVPLSELTSALQQGSAAEIRSQLERATPDQKSIGDDWRMSGMTATEFLHRQRVAQTMQALQNPWMATGVATAGPGAPWAHFDDIIS